MLATSRNYGKRWKWAFQFYAKKNVENYVEISSLKLASQHDQIDVITYCERLKRLRTAIKTNESGNSVIKWFSSATMLDQIRRF